MLHNGGWRSADKNPDLCRRMEKVMVRKSDIRFQPVTPERWKDLERLFGPRGACSGCWCMWYRIKRSEWSKNAYEGNREALKRIVDSGRVPGLLAYVDDEPAGWVSVAPREEFASLERSHVLKRVDDRPAWSIVCFFVSRAHRRQGLSQALVRAAVDHAAAHGATLVEGYPVEHALGSKFSTTDAFPGSVATFEREGFREVTRRSPRRPIMRRRVRRRRKT
jgi:GNAT superfamily N-acetyltransferase